MSACGTVDQGRPIPEASTTSTTSTTTVPPTSKAASGPDLTALNPCTLVTDSELGQLGLDGEPRTDTKPDGPTCGWVETGLVLIVAVHPTKGLRDFNTRNATRVEERTIGGHSGRVVERPGGFCDVDIAVTEESSVVLSVTMLDEPSAACPTAERAAAFVEPRVPQA